MPEKAGFLESFSPWSSRSTTPKPTETGEKPTLDSKLENLAQSKASDHSIPNRPRISPRDYPGDCPKSIVQWFYAIDSPKRKPQALNVLQTDSKPFPVPKKYAPFSRRDSKSIERAFQRLAERDRVTKESQPSETGVTNSFGRGHSSSNLSLDGESDHKTIKVAVNEDYLFDVDIDRRELAPAYWLGSIYDVRRGSWFYQEGSLLRPCEENLATQLEEGYLKVNPWRNPLSATESTNSPVRTIAKPENPGEKTGEVLSAEDNGKEAENAPAKFELQTQRLFGAYINSVVTYQDAETAWILSDDLLSRMSSTVYQRFAGGGHLGGQKVLRGYKESQKGITEPENSSTDPVKTDEAPAELRIGESQSEDAKQELQKASSNTPSPEPTILKLERQVSNFMSSPTIEDAAKQEADTRKRSEEEMREDYVDADDRDQGREIEHLILVTHGIGQRLGLRMESVNFIHDVNVLRKTLKSVYDTSPDLRALNGEVDKLPHNSRVQVLPVVWRHLLDFPKKSFKHNREQDLTDVDMDEEYPSLDNITVDGVPAIRQLISDLALDILLYQSAYREHIASIVRQECNRVYDLFISRNPNFRGKISLLGHSLGSAILFDILCTQPDDQSGSHSISSPKRHSRPRKESVNQVGLGLRFDVEDFYCLGSPLGLYQMLKGHVIRGRSLRPAARKRDSLEDPFLGPASSISQGKAHEILSVGISSPKCARLFNIFHPADPIAYRVEPLVSNAMSSLKPQPLPYTKKGIFGVQGQGFSNIGARVGQSVSGMWTNLTSGVASSLLNRSLGISGEQMASSQASSSPKIQHRRETSSSMGTGDEKDLLEEHPPTLLDTEKVTLYSEFEKQRRTLQSDEGRDLGERSEWAEAERRARSLKAEEAKVRALNSNGRIDYSIQEGVFDISLIASIASHLSYWADEDVSHFMISQLLSRQRVIKR